ncbi:MAG: hypothetical protein JSV88_00770 [Candidatus Aminicenantes bacterium]|nr:MAG: hypothetical protein JSV88_00770 [Candidatus Aminicenantes bacterium]
MILIKKNRSLGVLVGALILLMIPTGLLARFMANGSGGGYVEGDKDSSGKAGFQCLVNPIERYVIEGAAYYLDAYSDVLAFLNRVEGSDLKAMDYEEAQQVLDRALGNMNNAAKAYYHLIRRAESTPYNETVISKLMDFDYTGFMQEWGLNSGVFKKVEEHLQTGNITGIYKQIYTEFTTITGELYSMREELSANKLPQLSDCWRLNECCSRTLLFGQYVSRVFYAIR